MGIDIFSMLNKDIYLYEEKANFLLKISSKLSASSLKTKIAMWNKISIEEKIVGKNLFEFDENDYIAFFKNFDMKTQNSFHTTRSHIKRFLIFYSEEKSLKAIKNISFDKLYDESLFLKYYFSDITELCFEIDKRLFYGDINNANRLTLGKLVLLLVWYGIEPLDLCDVKVSDVKSNGVMYKNTIIKMDLGTIEFLNLYIRYNQNLNPDSFLITKIKQDSSSNIGLIRQYVSLLNIVTDDDKKVFELEKVYDSGKYYRICIYEFTYGNLRKEPDRNKWFEFLKMKTRDGARLSQEKKMYYYYKKYVFKGE